MGVYKRGRLWWITYIGIDGIQCFESSKSNIKADAEYILACRKKDIGEGKEPVIKKIPNYTFLQLSEIYLDFVKIQRSYPSKKVFVKLLNLEFGNILLNKFNIMMIEQYQSKRISDGKKPATVNRAIATLKHMFTKALEWEMIMDDIYKKIKKVKFMPENNRRLRYLSKEECRELINLCEPHLRPIVITALNTGMRKSKILFLKWDNVDLKHGFILLDITKNGERMEIPINETLRSILESIVRRIDIPYVFYNPQSGKPYRDIKRSFHTACRKAKIRDFRFHDLRHTFASHLVMSGVDITTVSRLLGHKSLTMTLRYAHLAPNHLSKAVNMLSFAAEKKPTTLNKIKHCS